MGKVMNEYNCEECGADSDSLPRDCCDQCIVKFYLEDMNAPAYEHPGNCNLCASVNRHPAGKALNSEMTDLDELRAKFQAMPKKAADDLAVNVTEIADINIALLLRKHRDYGPKNIAQAPGGALNGLRVRMHDKLARINHLLDSGATPENESLIDSFVDLGNYALIAQLVIRGEWPNE